MRLIFCKSNTISSWLIRLLTFSEWSHVGIEYNGVVYDSTARHGVTSTPKKEWLKKYGTVFSIDVDLSDEYSALVFVLSQRGKKYDFLALLALPLRSDWQDEQKWFCSELAAKALMVGGRKLRLPSHRITPRDLFLVA